MCSDLALPMMASLGGLDRIAHYMKANLSDEEYKKYIYRIGNSMAELTELSNGLHRIYPDITPAELQSSAK
jgi:hypothetical protein